MMKNLLALLSIAGILSFSPSISMGTEEQHVELLQAILDGTVTYEQINEFQPPRFLLSGLLAIAVHAENSETLDILLHWLQQWLENQAYTAPEIKDITQQELQEALEAAAWLGKVSATQKLLLFGASANARDNEALMRAVVGNKSINSSVVSLLLHHGANGFARQGAALREAVTTKKEAIVEILLLWAEQHSQDQLFSADLINELLEYTDRNHLSAIHDSLQEYRRASSPKRRKISR